jgi:hypothetical protein
MLGALGAAAALMVLVPWMTAHQASAAGLLVRAGPLQVWTMQVDLPVLPAAAVVSDLVASAEPAEADALDDTVQPSAGAEHGTSGTAGDSDPAAEPGSGEDPGVIPDVDLTDCGDLSEYDEVLYGTAEDDELTATGGRQILVGLGGDDVLRGGKHDDCLLGGNGDDELEGGAGDDYLDGGHGHDVLEAGFDPGDVCADVGSDELMACGPVEPVADDASTEVKEPTPTEAGPSESGSNATESNGNGTDAQSPGSPGGNDTGAEHPSEAPTQEPGPPDTVADAGEAVVDTLAGE